MRRRELLATTATTSIADNVFVIDNITFEEVNMWGISGYDMYIENINTIKSLKNFIVENGYKYSGHDHYEIDPSQIELYLYDYKIPVSDVMYDLSTNTLNIYYQEGDATQHVITMPEDSHVLGPSESGTWKFNYIPTTSVEAILFVEFAKQYGVDAIKIDGYTVEWYEEGKSLLIINDNLFIDERIVYGAGNGMKSGTIHCGDYDGGISNYNYMTIYALEDGLQAKLIGNTISYSLDEGNTWTSLASDTYTPSVNSGEIIMFKGNLTPTSSIGIGTFSINKKCALMGNCNSLLFGDDTANNNSLSGKAYAFYNLFKNCTTIIQVSETFLPATTLASRCYYYMFYGCSSLTTAPELPATTLASNCYSSMFQSCTSLTTAPELPATTLYTSCYSGMFARCSKLNYIKMLATDISAIGCLNVWVSNVSSTGTFVKNQAMTSLPTGKSGIPNGWTVQTA